jgi:hypothetical protein
MPETSQPRRAGPPHNPGVRELVADKRQWSSPSNREDAKLGFHGWNEQRLSAAPRRTRADAVRDLSPRRFFPGSIAF